MKLFPNSAILWQQGLAFLLVGILTLTLAACNPSSLATPATSTPQIASSVLSDPKTFNYVLNQESPNIFGLTYEGLVAQNPITGEFEPALAESWQAEELKIVFTLRQGLKWSDGEPLTVDDVIFSYNDLFLNEEIPTNVRDSLRIGQSRDFPEVKKLDDRRIEFAVPEPFAPFLGIAELAILPKHALQKYVETKDSEGKPEFISKWGVDTPPDDIIVNGPYKLKSYATSQRVIFERNPYYWRRDRQGDRQPYISEFVWEIVENQDTSLLQFRSGGLDAVSVSPDYFSLLKREEERGNFTIYNGGPAYGTSFIFFNLNTGKREGKPLVDPAKSRWFNNVKFRQAVAYGIDRQRMINNIYRGLGKPQNSPISVQAPFYNNSLKGYDYNPEQAKALLLEAGFKYNKSNQLEDEEGNRVRFTLMTNSGNKVRESMAAQISQDLAGIGIKVDLDPIAFNILVDKLSNSLEWDCCLLGLTGGNEPNDGANVWFPDGNLHMFNQKPQAGQKPIEGRQVAEWEEEIASLYIQGARELDPQKRKEIYAETQRIVEEYVPFVYLVNPLSLTAMRDRIQGIEYSALQGAFWNVHELKLAAE